MMTKRLKTSAGVLAGVSALALGAPVIAGAATTQTNSKAPAVERVPARDGDHLRSGNQTTPDTRDKVDAGSRNEKAAKASDRDHGKKAERSPKDRHGDR
jgi:hypothetical protein